MAFDYLKKIGKFVREEYVFCLTLIEIGFGTGRVYDHFTINKPLAERCERQRRIIGQLIESVELSNLVIEKYTVKELEIFEDLNKENIKKREELEELDKRDKERRKAMEYMDGLLKKLEEN